MNSWTYNGAMYNGYFPFDPFTSSYAEKSFFLDAGINNLRPQVRGTSIALILENKSTDGSWAVEEINGVVRDAGRRRL